MSLFSGIANLAWCFGRLSKSCSFAALPHSGTNPGFWSWAGKHLCGYFTSGRFFLGGGVGYLLQVLSLQLRLEQEPQTRLFMSQVRWCWCRRIMMHKFTKQIWWLRLTTPWQIGENDFCICGVSVLWLTPRNILQGKKIFKFDKLFFPRRRPGNNCSGFFLVGRRDAKPKCDCPQVCRPYFYFFVFSFHFFGEVWEKEENCLRQICAWLLFLTVCCSFLLASTLCVDSRWTTCTCTPNSTE